ncbi:MAG TPA: M36 family metallopeptidase [Kofleriaceae bacterium]
MGCATHEDTQSAERDQAIQALQQKAGAPVTVEANEAGTTRVIATTPGFPVPSRVADPAQAAAAFVTAHHDAFQLTEGDAASFVTTGVDAEPNLGVSHVNLQRQFNGIPVFEGGIQVVMDSRHNVIRATADERFRIAEPTNHRVLSAAEAATAAARSFGVQLALSAPTVEGLATTFQSPGTLDPVKVEPRIFQVAPGDDRFAHQVLLSWRDANKEQQYQLALIDAESGELLHSVSLVTTFTGRVFTAAVQPKVTDTTDNRVVVSFDGDPTASPSGWVTTPANKTAGNNAVACTDLNANNVCDAGDIQPVANPGTPPSFDFPYSPTTDAASFRPAAVTNAFYYVNDFHDRTYALGFTEASRNFQTNNFGKGGTGNDPVNVDAQDGSGTNNANFATPPDGSSPRMQMFLFNIRSATVRQDGDFDGSVVYHENTHGLSNRLVGGGATTCLNALQSGGMGEGWGDFMGSSFRNDPVVGAYVTGNTTVGIRRASMALSPFNYNDIKIGNLAEVHDIGELWAATLWDIRRVLGAAKTEALVVQGMKNTACHPPMINARDGILMADVTINGGANRCALWRVFADRGMGNGASSASDSTTTGVVTSSALPTDCPVAGVTRNFSATGLPLSIPDNNATGVRASITVSGAADLQRLLVDINLSHTFRGDLVIQLIAPNGATATLSNRQGGSADNFITTGQGLLNAFPAGTPASGTWQLFVRDLAAADVGAINSVTLHITSST